MDPGHFRTFWRDTSAMKGWDLRWLVSEKVFNNIIVAVGIITGLIAPRFYVTLKAIITSRLLHPWIKKIIPRYKFFKDHLKKLKTLEEVFVHSFVRCFKVLRKPRKSVANVDGDASGSSTEVELVEGENEKPKKKKFEFLKQIFSLGFLSGASLGALIGLLILFAVMPPWLDAGNLVISNSRNAGIWNLIPVYGNRSVVDTFVFFREMESRAADYAYGCYQLGPGKYGSNVVRNGCNYFANASIAYSVTDDDDCIFDDPSSCLLGRKKSAITMDTGHIPVGVLGINSRRKFTFRRRMRCAPVVTKGHYSLSNNLTGIDVNLYLQYGPAYGADYTLAWGYRDSNSFAYKVVVVNNPDLKGILGSRLTASDKFDPLPAFQVRKSNDTSLSFIFIDTGTISYVTPVHDPLFQATEAYSDSVQGATYYRRNTTVPTVLGCSDKGEVCDVKSGICWDTITPRYEIPKLPTANAEEAAEVKSVQYLLYYSLISSNANGAIAIRGGEALDAAKELGGLISASLPNNQWKIECKRVFETSLATAQYSLYDIATGTWSSEPKYFRDSLSAENRTRTVSLVKVRTYGGRKNVHLSGLLVYIFILCLLFMVSWNPWIDREAWKNFKSILKTLFIPIALVLKPIVWVLWGITNCWKGLFRMEELPEQPVLPAPSMLRGAGDRSHSKLAA